MKKFNYLKEFFVLVGVCIACNFTQAQTTTTVCVTYGTESATSSQNYTFPALPGTDNLTAEVWGAGGGGGGARASWSGVAVGGGGGGGAYATANFGSINSVLDIVVGYGGTPGTGNANGIDGGFSQISFSSSFIKANGGKLGKGEEKNIAGTNRGAAGAGGTYETGGTYVFDGANGGAGSEGDSGTLSGIGGVGGNAGGNGGTGGSAVYDGDGRPGNFPGGGGAGGGLYKAGWTAGEKRGGKGGNGKAQITFSYPTPAKPVISSALANHVCFENEIILTIENYDERFAYQWYKDNMPIENATDATYTVSSPGAYLVEVSGVITDSSFNFEGAVSVIISTNGDVSSVSGTTLNIGLAKEKNQSRAINFVFQYDKSDGTDFGDVAVGTTGEIKKQVGLTPSYLAGTINVSLEGGETSAFSVNENQFVFDGQDKTIEISFSPNKVGVINDVLIITSLNTSVTARIPLSGTGTVDAPVALDATNVMSSRFTANWESVIGVDNYLLTVKDVTGEILAGYNALNVGNVTNYPVSNLLPESDYTYTVQAVVDEYITIPSNEIAVTTPKGPVITYSIPALLVTTTNATDSKTIRVVGSNLIDIISVRIEDDNNYFSTEISELPKEGGKVLVTFAPDAVGKFTAKLILSSSTMEEVEVLLSGASLPVAVATLPATDVTDVSFTANWEASGDAVNYKLTVTDGNSIILDGVLTGNQTNYPVTGLTAGTLYTYTVEVVSSDDVFSAMSDVTKVLTRSIPKPYTISERTTSISIGWLPLAEADSYKVSLFKEGTVVPGFDQQAVSATTYEFSGLTENTTYTYTVSSVCGEEIYTSSFITANTKPAALKDQVDNSGFELWDDLGSDSREPQHWNSFMHGAGSLIGFAQGRQVDVSSDVRPGSEGTRSVEIFSESVWGKTANGNLTTGQIQANSMTPSDVGNHNKTIRSNSQYSMEFTAKPDSMTIWTKYVPINGSDQARVAVAIHDDYDYQDPNNGSLESHVVAKAIKNYPATADKGWQRLSIPFDYNYSSNDPRYILISLTTNKVGGEGNVGDKVFADDILLIYKPTLQAGTLGTSTYNYGDQIVLPYTLTGTMSPYNINAAANVVSFEISDASGSFASPRVLQQVTTNEGGALTGVIPDDLPAGTGYKVRVVTTNYPMTSNCETTVTIKNRIPAVPVASEGSNPTAASFSANWEPVAYATGYIITVNGTQHVVEGGDVTSYVVTGLVPETSYTYTVKAVNVDQVSDPSNAISIRTSDEGLISFEAGSISDFATDVTISAEQTLTITGIGLMYDILITKSGANADFFTVDASLPSEGGDLTITYTPTELGEHTALLILKSEFAANQSITLRGAASLAPPASLDATAVTPWSFVAEWDAAPLAGSYLLTVAADDETIIEDRVVAGTSSSVEGLSPNTNYTFTVKAVNGETVSRVSGEKEITTIPVPEIIAETSVSFEIVNNTSDVKTITIEGINLVENIEFNKTGSDYFTVTKVENSLEITYLPTELGSHAATVTLSTLYAQDVEIEISGYSRIASITAKSADDVTPVSFLAQWESSDIPGVTYLLTVTNENGVIEGYDGLSVDGSSQAVTGLSGNTTYAYTVRIVSGENISIASDEIEVTTLPVPVIEVETNAVAFNVVYGENDQATVGFTATDVIDGEDVQVDIDADGVIINIIQNLNEFVISYNPTAITESSATITLSSLYAETQVITIVANCRPAVTTTELATNVTPVSFTANWNASDMQEASYLLTVTNENEEAVEGFDKLTVTGTSCNVAGLSAGTTYTYYVEVVINEQVSAISDKRDVTTAATPQIVCGTTLAFEQECETSDSKTITVSCSNLFDELVHAISATEHFSVSREEGTHNVIVTYTPAGVGEHSAIVTLSSSYAQDVEVAVSGVSRPAATTVFADGAVTYSSFVAKWNASPLAGASYLLTVTDANDNIVATYDELNVGNVTSYEVTGLLAETSYSYTVKVLVNNIASVSSNEANIITTKTSPIEKVSQSKVTVYPNPVSDVLYFDGINVTVASIFSVNGTLVTKASVQESRVDVSHLSAGTYLILLEGEGKTYQATFVKK